MVKPVFKDSSYSVEKNWTFISGFIFRTTCLQKNIIIFFGTKLCKPPMHHKFVFFFFFLVPQIIKCNTKKFWVTNRQECYPNKTKVSFCLPNTAKKVLTKKFLAKQIIFEQLSVSAVRTVAFCISDTINRICFQISYVLTVNGSQISWSHPHEIVLFRDLDGGTVHARQPFVSFVSFYW